MTIAITTTVLVIMLLSSTFMLGSSAVVKPSTYATPLSATTNYGDLLQYDWPQAGYDEGFSSGNPGPGPEKANILWKVNGAGSSIVSAFDGKIFIASHTTVRALDPFTGAIIWNSAAPAGTPSPQGNNAIFKLDNTYFLTQGTGGITVRRTSDGTFVMEHE